jgi:crossover junction endodeoxyribonuclease RusA
VALHVSMRDRRIADIDNRVKAALDALTHAGVYDDDSQIDELLVCRGEIVKGGRLGVMVMGA